MTSVDDAARRAEGALRYSLVLPIFNEEAVLPLLLARIDALMDALDGPAEAIFVDDGSRDTSGLFLRLKARQDPRYRYIGLSRNFGHQIAITAGMDAAEGEAVIVMDADLQDPPEIVLDMVAKWAEGYDVVYARRRERHGESRFKRWTADAFYRLLARFADVDIPRNVGDFRLVDRKVVEAFRGMPEQDRFVRGMFAWLGFRQTAVEFERAPREAGATKYTLRRMTRLAANALIGFSDAPLKLVVVTGFTVSLLAGLYGAYVVARWLAGAELVTGWASTILIVALLGGGNMLMTGIVGLYVGRIHAEVKRRPLYVVAAREGFAHAAATREADAPPLQRAG
ncbi:MAG: glycosyltransferase family 2 protein [Methylobacteriaceae bacterium]|nr:glycosyltransferase family 2 protein [Methylobacteriaceae bacterium]